MYLRDKQGTFSLDYTVSFFGGMPVFKVAKFEPRDVALALCGAKLGGSCLLHLAEHPRLRCGT